MAGRGARSEPSAPQSCGTREPCRVHESTTRQSQGRFLSGNRSPSLDVVPYLFLAWGHAPPPPQIERPSPHRRLGPAQSERRRLRRGRDTIVGPDTPTPGGISSLSRTSPVRGSTRLKSLSSPSQVPCQSSPSTQVTPVTKRLDSIVRRIAPVWGFSRMYAPLPWGDGSDGKVSEAQSRPRWLPAG